MERELVLVRHGEAGDPSVYWGTRNVALSERGRRSARALAARCPTGLRSVYCSPQLRAVETATLLVEGSDAAVVPEQRLAAKDYGELTGWSKSTVHAQRHPYSTPLDKWTWTPPNGESYRHVAVRVTDFLTDVWMTDPGPLLVVTHESTLKVIAVLCERALTVIDRPFHFDEVRTYRLAEPPTLPG